MKKLVFPLIAATFLFASCAEQQQGMTDNEIEAKVDSVVGSKQPQLLQEADEDLNNRAAAEVKEKADSIVTAVKNK